MIAAYSGVVSKNAVALSSFGEDLGCIRRHWQNSDHGVAAWRNGKEDESDGVVTAGKSRLTGINTEDMILTNVS